MTRFSPSARRTWREAGSSGKWCSVRTRLILGVASYTKDWPGANHAALRPDRVYLSFLRRRPGFGESAPVWLGPAARIRVDQDVGVRKRRQHAPFGRHHHLVRRLEGLVGV